MTAVTPTDGPSLSRTQARRVALVAQGFRDPRHTVPTMRTFNRTLSRTAVLQIDSVNVLQRAHYMPLFSRMGPYDTDLLRRASEQRPRRIVEYWAHVAAFMPVELWPHMRHRMRAFEARGHDWEAIRHKPELVDSLLAEVADRGASTPRDLDDGLPRKKEHWGWNWSETKKVMEYLFASGQLAVAGRNQHFERVYDLPERVIPPEHLNAPEPTVEEASVELLRRAAVAHGVGTELDLRDYFRMRPELTKPALATLVESGELLPVRVEGWGRQAYLHRDAALPRRVHARALLSPVRPARLGARTHRAALRLPLPHRDLRARAEAGARLLRAALPARRPDRGPRRPQGGPQGRRAAGARGVRRARRARGDGRRAGGRAARPRDLAGPGGRRGRVARRSGS